MEKFRNLEHLKAQLTVVRWHLDAAQSADVEKRRAHLDCASLTHQGALELLAKLSLPDAQSEAIGKQLAELGKRLRAALAAASISASVASGLP